MASKIIHVLGRRKRAIAKATLKPGKGRVVINKISIEDFQPKMTRLKIQEPIQLAGNAIKKYDISVNTFGGGFQSQAEAARLAIAKSLIQVESSLKKDFLDYDRHLLIADVRRKEKYKPNDSKARAKRQKSKR